MDQIVVIATLHAKSGKERELEQALTDLVDPTHAEDGCFVYALHRGLDDPARFALVEGYSSRESLDSHLATEHVSAALAKLGNMLDQPPDMASYSPLGLGEPAKGVVGASVD